MAYALVAAPHARAYQVLIRMQKVDPDWLRFHRVLLSPKITAELFQAMS
jgi:hypothetical protein